MAMKAFSMVSKVHAWCLFHQARAGEKGGVSIEAAFVIGTLITIATIIAARFVTLGDNIADNVPTTL